MITSLLFTAFLGALPTSPTVVAGNVTFDTSTPGVLIVTSTSDRSIVSWNSFSVDGSDTVIFQLPFATSAILNKVTGSTPSQIDGFIYASQNANGNGIVYLVNNNGISKGSVATVLTNGFLASTLNANNGEFLAGGAMTFTDSTQQAINNDGSIVTYLSDTILLGYQVNHTGNITAAQGFASLGAGSQIVLQPSGPQRLSIVSGSSGSTTTGLTTGNISTINSLQAELMADGALYTNAIDHEGTITINGTGGASFNLDSTNGLSIVNGMITCQNSDGTGGLVTVLGNSILLNNSCFIDCSGQNGGGQIFVGGGPFGSVTPYNAQTTIMQIGARLITDATQTGNGGQAVLWANGTTNFFGNISSLGGIQSGDGGTAQVCGLTSLTNDGYIDVSAPAGQEGTIYDCTSIITPSSNGLPPQH